MSPPEKELSVEKIQQHNLVIGDISSQDRTSASDYTSSSNGQDIPLAPPSCSDYTSSSNGQDIPLAPPSCGDSDSTAYLPMPYGHPPSCGDSDSMGYNLMPRVHPSGSNRRSMPCAPTCYLPQDEEGLRLLNDWVEVKRQLEKLPNDAPEMERRRLTDLEALAEYKCNQYCPARNDSIPQDKYGLELLEDWIIAKRRLDELPNRTREMTRRHLIVEEALAKEKYIQYRPQPARNDSIPQDKYGLRLLEIWIEMRRQLVELTYWSRENRQSLTDKIREQEQEQEQKQKQEAGLLLLLLLLVLVYS